LEDERELAVRHITAPFISQALILITMVSDLPAARPENHGDLGEPEEGTSFHEEGLEWLHGGNDV
jgi:hypothetical protein